MREVRLLQLHISRSVRRLLPVIPLALGFAAVAVADHGSLVAQQGTADVPVSSPQASPAASPTTFVTVDGRPVPVGEDGNAHVTLPDNAGQVDVSGGGAKVSTNGGSGSGGSGNHSTNVTVNSNSPDESGTNSNSTEVVGASSNANGSSMSFTSTNVFSTSSNNSYEQSSQ